MLKKLKQPTYIAHLFNYIGDAKRKIVSHQLHAPATALSWKDFEDRRLVGPERC
jgi:hypothetical protein